jgi:hypothetical protein
MPLSSSHSAGWIGVPQAEMRRESLGNRYLFAGLPGFSTVDADFVVQTVLALPMKKKSISARSVSFSRR